MSSVCITDWSHVDCVIVYIVTFYGYHIENFCILRARIMCNASVHFKAMVFWDLDYFVGLKFDLVNLWFIHCLVIPMHQQLLICPIQFSKFNKLKNNFPMKEIFVNEITKFTTNYSPSGLYLATFLIKNVTLKYFLLKN